MPEAITFFNRHSGRMETEQVYGEGFLRWVYETGLGRVALRLLVRRAFFSRWYGWRMDAGSSAAKIELFIRQYGLDPSEFADDWRNFRCFNEFFYRKLKGAARPICGEEDTLVLPADGRHLLVADVSAEQSFWVKGQPFDVGRLLGDAGLAKRYEGGSALVSRLCPVDYHRFHYPCAGRAGGARLVNGDLCSVSPIALRWRPGILWENKRFCGSVHSAVFGEVQYLEIGATCVGSVVHTAMEQEVGRGDERGYFRFGGSCVMTLFEAGRVRWDEDLLHYGGQGIEVYARMGERAGQGLG